MNEFEIVYFFFLIFFSFYQVSIKDYVNAVLYVFALHNCVHIVSIWESFLMNFIANISDSFELFDNGRSRKWRSQEVNHLKILLANKGLSIEILTDYR